MPFLSPNSIKALKAIRLANSQLYEKPCIKTIIAKKGKATNYSSFPLTQHLSGLTSGKVASK